jgi:hypothetical protein
MSKSWTWNEEMRALLTRAIRGTSVDERGHLVGGRFGLIVYGLPSYAGIVYRQKRCSGTRRRAALRETFDHVSTIVRTVLR